MDLTLKSELWGKLSKSYFPSTKSQFSAAWVKLISKNSNNILCHIVLLGWLISKMCLINMSRCDLFPSKQLPSVGAVALLNASKPAKPVFESIIGFSFFWHNVIWNIELKIMDEFWAKKLRKYRKNHFLRTSR